MAKLILYQTKSPYEGDITKNCEMTGKEIDSNFLNLKGDDIKTIVLDDETHILTVTRNKDGHRDCNGEVINSRFEIDLNRLGFINDLKSKDGKLIGTKSDGTTVSISLNDISVLCSTDGTIDGNGSTAHPLSISRGSRTGQYSPCLSYIDVTAGEKLPEEPVVGERYITKEEISIFGKLYPYDAVWKVQKDLEAANYPWRIPTKHDWDCTLMLLEGCKELPSKYKSHFSKETGNLGRFAGRMAKSPLSWDEPELNADNMSAMNIFATGFRDAAGNWNAGSDYHGVGKSAAYWTSTLREGDKMDDDGYKVYVKRFDAYKTVNGEKIEVDTVRQDVYPQTSRLSIKLVKDYDGTNFNESEDIFGTYYPCELVDARTEDEELNEELNAYFKPRVWISVNLDYVTEKIENEVEDSPLTGTTETRFFVNDWDGTKWVRQQMVYGDSVVLTNNYVDESGETRVHEYRLLKDEAGYLQLVDLDSTSEGQIEEILEHIEEIEERVNTVTQSVGINEDGTINPFENELIASATTVTDAIETLADVVEELAGGAGSEIDNIERSVGLADDGSYIPTTGITSDAESVMEAVQMLDDAVQGSAGLVGEVIESVGLAEDGSYIPKEDTHYLDEATSIEGEIKALDKQIGKQIDDLNELTENIVESVGLDEDGKYIRTSGEYTNDAHSFHEAVEKLDAQAESNQHETDTMEENIGLDEDGKFIPKPESNYLRSARTVEGEIMTLDEVVHDKEIELQKVEESVGLKAGSGELPDEYHSTNVIDNGMTVIEAIETIDKKIGKPTDVRRDGETDEQISLYAFINESDYGEF